MIVLGQRIEGKVTRLGNEVGLANPASPRTQGYRDPADGGESLGLPTKGKRPDTQSSRVMRVVGLGYDLWVI
jgi:hypothetical protein